MTPGNVHFAPPVSAPIAGLWGWWQVSQARPVEWSAEATCGKLFGFAALASWQRAQSTAVSSFGGFHGSWVVRMLGQRSVAGFAIHVRVLAILLLLKDVGMAGFAGLVAGEIHGPGRDFRHCVAAVVPILARNFLGPETRGAAGNRRMPAANTPAKSKKMSCILEGIHMSSTKTGCGGVLSASSDRRNTDLFWIQETRLNVLCWASPYLRALLTEVGDIARHIRECYLSRVTSIDSDAGEGRSCFLRCNWSLAVFSAVQPTLSDTITPFRMRRSPFHHHVRPATLPRHLRRMPRSLAADQPD